MPLLARRDWVPSACEDLVQSIAAGALDAEIARLGEARCSS